MATIASAYVQIIPSAKGISGSLSKAMSGEASNAGASAGENIASKIKGAIVKAGIGAAVGKIFKDSIDAGGALQQSFGGLETIYGDAAEAAKNYAYEASKAGISANDYAEQAVSFGASLKQAFGGDTTKAVEAANTAIMDMTDNAAKMGTPIENIQNAYQGFAKQNYTMLDNLKLGYGGTKTEMERLLKDAQELSGVEYNIDNLGDVYDAIHVIQEDLGLTGVAAQEASETFSGSFGAMKASAKNLLANMALGQDVRAPLNSLLQNTKTFLVGNFLPMIGNILKSVPAIIGTAFQFAITEIPQMLSSLFTTIQTTATALLSGEGGGIFDSIITAFTSIDWEGAANTAMEMLGNALSFAAETLPLLLQNIGLKAINFFQSIDWIGLGQRVINFILSGIQILAANIPTLLQNIGKTAMTLFRAINWIQLGRTVITLIKSGIQALFQALPTILKSIGTTALNLFKSINWASVGRAVINLIKSGIRALFTAIPTLLKTIGTSAMASIKSISWSSVGTAIVNGIKSGISSLAGSLISSVKSLGARALSGIKGILGIASPSKAFAEVGADMAAGIQVGWEKNLPVDDMIADTKRMTDDLSAAAQFSTTGTVAGTSSGDKLDAILQILAYYFPELLNRDITLDSDKVIGALTPGINRKLGMIAGW